MSKAAKTAPKRISGRSLSDAERSKNGWGRITLRLPAETITLIGIMAEDRGMSRAEFVTELVEQADMDHPDRVAEDESEEQ